jgi:hypothetical protein
VTARSISPAERTLVAERWGRALNRAELANRGRYGNISQDRRSRHAGRDLFEQFQPFSADREFERSKAGGVSARPCQAIDEAGADRIGDLHEHDRHGARLLQQRPRGCTADREDDVGRERSQFRGVSTNALGVARSPAQVDANVAPVGPAQLTQRLGKRQQASVPGRIVRGEGHEHADASHALGLLRARRARPRGGTAKRGYQFPPSDREWHETLLARARKIIPRREHAVSPFASGGVLIV